MRRLLTSAAFALLFTTSVAGADPAVSPPPQTTATDSAVLAPGPPAGEHEASLISAPAWTAIAAVAIVAVIVVAVTASENNTTVTTH
jgi:hypothetical protein